MKTSLLAAALAAAAAVGVSAFSHANAESPPPPVFRSSLEPPIYTPVPGPCLPEAA